MRMSDCETVDDILTEFAKRDPAGYVVWGQKIGRAYRDEAKNRENESRAANNLNDALNAEVKRLTAENTKLRALVKELADALEKIDDMADGDMCKFFDSTQHCSKCKYIKSCETGVAHNALKTHESEISKAREAIA